MTLLRDVCKVALRRTPAQTSTTPPPSNAVPMYTLLENPPPDQETWNFTVPPAQLEPRRRRQNDIRIFGKCIRFTAEAITLEINQMPSNRVLLSDDHTKFLLVSFEKLRFPESGLKVIADYISRLMKAGLFINGKQYRFYHHSNSQLVRVRCLFLRSIMLRCRKRGVGRASCARPIMMLNWMQSFINWEIMGRL